jgi:5-formyltetrahydrofolate cyclo-ligase
MPDPSSDKSLLRRQMRALRDAIDQPTRAAASRRAARLLGQLPGWRDVSTLAIYLPQGGELDTSDICAHAVRESKEVYLPVLVPGNRLDFARWQPGETLTPNRFGIPEPGDDAERREPDALDLICLPLVAWNGHGDRLGMGGGYYDRSLATCSSVKVGIGYELQRSETLVPEPWDVRLDFVLTESALHRCAGNDRRPSLR